MRLVIAAETAQLAVPSTTRTSQPACRTSAYRCKAENIRSQRCFRTMTRYFRPPEVLSASAQVPFRACASWRLRSAMKSLKVPTAPEGSVSGADHCARGDSRQSAELFLPRGRIGPHSGQSTAWPLGLTSNCSMVTPISLASSRRTNGYANCSLGNNEDRSAASTRGIPVFSRSAQVCLGDRQSRWCLCGPRARIEEIGRDLHVNHVHARSAECDVGRLIAGRDVSTKCREVSGGAGFKKLQPVTQAKPSGS